MIPGRWHEAFGEVLGTPDEEELARIVQERGWVSADQLRACVEEQMDRGHPFLAAILLERRLLTPRQLAEALREEERRLLDLAGESPSGAWRLHPVRQGIFFGSLLLARGLVTADALRRAVRAGGRVCAALAPDADALRILRENLHCASCGEPFADPAWTPEKDLLCPACASGVPPHERDRDGAPFGRYRLLEEIGRGAQGILWKAWDPRLQREVALKQILPRAPADPDRNARLLREADAAGRLRHPGLLPVHDAGIVDGQAYLVTDLYPGPSLEKIKKTIPIDRALAVVQAVAEALEYAHRHGIVHCDVKPANILLDAEGRPCLTDFGLSKDLTRERIETTRGEWLAGSLPYLSPEQVSGSGSIGPAADQFALGCVLYELATGRPPFLRGSVRATLNAIVSERPVPPSRLARVPPGLDAVCLRALEKSPGRRYPDLQSFAQDLGRVRRGEPVARPPRLRIWVGAAAAVVGAVFLVQGHGGENPLEQALDRERAGDLAGAAAAFREIAAREDSPEARAGLKRTGDALARRAEEAARAEAHRSALEKSNALVQQARPLVEAAIRSLYEEETPFDEPGRLASQAIPLLRNALAFDPRLPVALHLLGRAEEVCGNEEEALAWWKRACEADPAFAPAHLNIARLLIYRSFLHLTLRFPGLRKDKSKEAARLIEEAVRELRLAQGFESEFESDLALAMLACCRRDPAALRERIRIGLERHKTEGSEEFHMLDAVVSSGDARLAALDRVLRIRPKHPYALMVRAIAKAQRGDVDGAIADYTNVLVLRPRFAPAWTNLAELRRGRGELASAIEAYTRAIASDPSVPEFLYNRGLARSDANDLEGALEDLDRAIREGARFPNAFIDRGRVRERLGHVEAAIEDYEEALRLDSKCAEGFMHRGLAGVRLGLFDRAVADLEQALRVAPPDWPYIRPVAGSVEELKPMAEAAPAWLADAVRGREKMRRGEREKAREWLERAVSQAPPRGRVLREVFAGACYDLARLCASERPDAAFDLLRRAAALGFRYPHRWQREADLAPLRSDPRWARLFEEKTSNPD